MSNDWVVFRYGDILLGLAEAEMRLEIMLLHWL